MVIPPEIRAELTAHAQSEAPNEACGLIVLRGERAERYVQGRNTLASPYRFQLEVDRTQDRSSRRVLEVHAAVVDATRAGR